MPLTTFRVAVDGQVVSRDAAIVTVPFILRTQIGRAIHAIRSRFGSRGAGADDVAGTR